MYIFISIVLTLNLIIALYLIFAIRKLRLKNRIIESFISGIIRSISDYFNGLTDHKDFIGKYKSDKLPISYDNILENICLEFDKDMLYNEEFSKTFIHKGKLFFGQENTSKIKVVQMFLDYFGESFSNNRGFFQMYLDFFEKYNNEWSSQQPSHNESNSSQMK